MTTPTTPPPVHTDSPTCACEDCARVRACGHENEAEGAERRCYDCGALFDPVDGAWKKKPARSAATLCANGHNWDTGDAECHDCGEPRPPLVPPLGGSAVAVAAPRAAARSPDDGILRTVLLGNGFKMRRLPNGDLEFQHGREVGTLPASRASELLSFLSGPPAPTAEGGALAIAIDALKRIRDSEPVAHDRLLSLLRAAQAEHAAQLDERARSFGSATLARQKAEREVERLNAAVELAQYEADSNASARDGAVAKMAALAGKWGAHDLSLNDSIAFLDGEMTRAKSAAPAPNLGELRAKLEALRKIINDPELNPECPHRHGLTAVVDGILALLPAHGDRKTEAGR